MTPEYIDQLADRADPDDLWRLPGLEQLDLPMAKRRQLDTGVALRRYAMHLLELAQLQARNMSLLITPLSSNSSASKAVPTPQDHVRLRRHHGDKCEVCGATDGQHYGNCKHAIRGVNEIVGPGE